MNWFVISLFSYFLNAVSIIISKIILSDFETVKPAVYAFWINFFGIVVLFFLPFNAFLPEAQFVFAALLSGILNALAILILYNLLYREEASQVGPIVGGFTPIFIFPLAFLFLGEFLFFYQIIGFLLVVIGGFIASYEISVKKHLWYLNRRVILWSAVAALFFAISQVLIKFVFNNNVDFLSGFIWRGIGSLLGAIFILFYPKYFREIKTSVAVSSGHNIAKMGGIFILSQVAAFLGYVLINYAIMLGPVSLVNSFSGIQYVFLFLMVVFLSKFYPKILKENLNKELVNQKIVSIFLISIGIFILFI